MFAALFSPSPNDVPALMVCARTFSPRVERLLDGRLVLFDAAGLGRIVGDPETLAREIEGHLAIARSRDRAIPRFSVALAPSRTAALLLALGRSGTSVVLPGQAAAAAVGVLPLEVLERLARFPGAKPRPCALCMFCAASHRQARMLCGQPGGACMELPTLRRWGLSTLGDLAALPPADLASRLGQVGVALQRFARAADAQPLVPIVEEARFEASLDLEWPIEALEPLSFVLTRLLEPLSAALERADRAAAAIVSELVLVRLPVETETLHRAIARSSHRAIGGSPDSDRAITRSRDREIYRRRLQLPAPMRDARVLRTLILLDLASHPPPAGIDRLTVRLEPTPARTVQFSLLERAGPQPETVATLLSRLTALADHGRVGSPMLVDSHRPGSFAIGTFGPATWMARLPDHEVPRPPGPVLRRFRPPVPARVIVERGRPVRVTTDRQGIPGGAVGQCSGPWRGSGGWWDLPSSGDAEEAETQRNAEAVERQRTTEAAWDHDEYDVALADGAAYRIYRDRHENRWFVEGILD